MPERGQSGRAGPRDKMVRYTITYTRERGVCADQQRSSEKVLVQVVFQYKNQLELQSICARDLSERIIYHVYRSLLQRAKNVGDM